MELRQTEFVTIPQAAELLGVSPYVVRQSVRLHGLPVVKWPTGAVRIRRNELQTWLDEQQRRTEMVGA